MTESVFRPALMAAFAKPPDAVGLGAAVAEGLEEVKPVLTLVEDWLSKSSFITGDAPTAADLLCYCELGQLKELGLFDYKPYPKISTWLGKMQKLPGYEQSAVGVQKLAGFMSKKFGPAKL